MEYKAFSVRIPKDLCDTLDAEARQRFRKRNARNQMIIDILAERYQPNVSTSTQTQPRTPRVAGVSRSAATLRSKRKAAETD